MNEKILKVVDKMSSSRERISEISAFEGEYYFRYDKKFVWSITHRTNTDTYILYFYPVHKGSVRDVIHDINVDPENIDVVFYKSEEFEDKQLAKNLMKNLYLFIKDALYDVDNKLDDILNS